MANQSQPRPRFRFGPMIRPIQAVGPPPSPAPAPAPRPAAAPLPRPSLIRPPFRPSFAAPPQRAQDIAAPPQLPSVTTTRKSYKPAPPDTIDSPLSSPVTRESFPSSPAPPDSHASLVARRSPSNVSPSPQKSPLPATPVTQKSPLSSPVAYNTLQSPITKKSPPGSRGTERHSSSKPAPRSLPSFSLPPSQLHSEGEYKREVHSIAEQKTVNPRSFPKPHSDNPKNSSAGINVKSKERETKRSSNPEDSGMRVITISGENRGAVMELGYSPGTHSTRHQLRSKGESSQGNSSRNEGRLNHPAKAIPSQPMHAFMNNNVQGINSSVVFNSTLSFHDPGIHFRLSRKSHPKDHANGQNLFSD